VSNPKYDVERFLLDIETVFKANLNTKIAEINTEKSTLTPETRDDFTLQTMGDDFWYLQHLPQVWSSKQFMVFGINAIDLKDQQEDNAIQVMKVFIEAVIPDTGDSKYKSNVFKSLRYTRALQEVAMENYDSIRSFGKLKIDVLVPTTVAIGNKTLQSSGIEITASITAR
jgi:hypothetical protein